MVDNKQIRKVNKFLQNQLAQKFSVFAIALLVVGSVAYFGTQHNSQSRAASVGVLSMTAVKGTAAATKGSQVQVQLMVDSGTDLINAVQASVSYDPANLQYASMTEGGAFTTAAATSTGTPGVIRVGRGVPSGTPAVSGVNTIVTLNFTVLGSSGTTSLSYDPAFSFIVRAADNVNTLTSVSGTSIAMKLPTPTISAVSPLTGPITGGTTVTITGSNFVSGASVKFDASVATNVVVSSPTSLTATVPSHAAGAATITVTNPDGQVATGQAGGFTFLAPAPTIVGISPNSGVTTGGTAVTITGTNFVAGATVMVDNSAATSVAVTSATSITAVMPAHASGGATVVVRNPDGQTASSTTGYVYKALAPTVSAVTPVSGSTAGGTRITVTGANFVNGATVLVGNLTGTSTVFVSSTSLTTVVPAQAAGTVAVAVTNPDGQRGVKAAAFTYTNPAPVISSISPLTGPVGGGVTVTITGSNFMNGARVSFGPTQAVSVAFVSSSTLTVVTPVGTAGGKEVIVTNPDNQATGGTAPIFTYVSNPGDANNDGRVNAIDLSILITHDGENYPAADFNGDNTVGSADMAILLGRWTW